MDSSQEEKQIFLRQNILDKGYDTNLFVEFLIGKKGEGGADVGNWTMVDLKKVVKEFIAMQENTENNNNLNQVEPQPEINTPIINQNKKPSLLHSLDYSVGCCSLFVPMSITVTQRCDHIG